MKRQVRITSFILLLSILLSSLISCGGKNAAFEKMDDREKAKYIVEKTDEDYEKSVEQLATLSCEIEGEVNGVAIKMELDGTATRTVTNANTDKMRYVSVSEVKSVTRTGTEKETENYTETSAFIDGYMYMGYDTDKKDGKDVYLKSALSAADFYTFLESSGIKSDEPEYSQICDNVAVTLSDDGKTYKVKITHGAENVKEELTKVTNELTSSFGITPRIPFPSSTYRAIALLQRTAMPSRIAPSCFAFSSPAAEVIYSRFSDVSILTPSG